MPQQVIRPDACAQLTHCCALAEAAAAPLGGSSIAGNINGVGVSNGGVLQSFGTNQITGNSKDGIASLTWAHLVEENERTDHLAL
ncbi:MAG: hypothetical protein JO273_03280 [Methylobacteriaceae bacterium]|nr:hypothetical protein [Methylobacteriaceae bacterium]